MSFQGFVVYENSDICVGSSGVEHLPNGVFSVIHGTPSNGRSVLFGLTKKEAGMAAKFLNEQESTPNFSRLMSRLLWANPANRGLDRLIGFSQVHGGVTMQSDPLNLAVKGGRIVFEECHAA